VVVKVALGEELAPVAIVAFRFIVAGGLLLVALFFKRNQKRNYRLLVGGRDAPTLVVLVLTCVTFFLIAQSLLKKVEGYVGFTQTIEIC
jgi:hypothetical protein